ncbi:MAG: hypothetical protein MJ016_06425 [Victivallaceae bacterium]|nr:hypothetical protein [Victivallaceae bacterium]
MKRGWIALVCCLAAEVLALRPGDAATKFEKVKWLRGGGIVAEGKWTPKNPGEEELRAAVFMLTRSGNAESTLRMLDSLRERYSYRLRTAVLTPDPQLDADEFLAKFPKDGVSFGLDIERKITPRYMAGSLLYPMAFLIDGSGKIIWCGEAVDLAEAVERYFSGAFDFASQREIALCIDEMETLMRDNSERKMEQVVANVLTLEPGHAGALRMRLFLLESRNRADDAWNLLQSQIKAAPKLARLYFTALDLISRRRQLEKHLPGLLADFRANIAEDRLLLAMAWNLLRAFDFDAVAVDEAGKLLDATAAHPSAQREAAAALYSYRVGDIDGAVAHQEKALQLLTEKSGPRRAEVDFFTDYYRKLRALPRR